MRPARRLYPQEWYESKLDKGRLLAYNYTNSEWDEIGIFDLPEINEPAWVILSGFSVESDLFMIDIDTNSGNLSIQSFGNWPCSIVILYRHMSLIFK